MAVPASVCEQVDTGEASIDELVPRWEETREWRTEAGARGVGVEKLWHAIHYVLSDGCVWESDGQLGELFMGGEPGSRDVGYGPARYHSPDAVAALARALAALSDEELEARFDPEALASDGVYPNIWDEDRHSLWEELGSYLTPLRALVARAGERGEGLLVWVS